MMKDNQIETPEKFNEGEALIEANRCLQCFDAPCSHGCPASIPIARFIRMMRSKNYEGACEVLQDANALIHSCGEICPDEDLCQKVCTSGRVSGSIQIRKLHQFVTWRCGQIRGAVAKSTLKGKKVAIIGAGPAGLSAARTLALKGVKVRIFEKESKAGGVLFNQIPTFKLKEDVVDADIQQCLIDGVEIFYGKEIVEPQRLREISNSHNFVLVATGVSKDVAVGIEKAGIKGLYTSTDYLKEFRKGKIKAEGNVVIIGGGNVAIDCALVAIRAGAGRAMIFYRRTLNEMVAWKREFEEALTAGVEFYSLSIPEEIIEEHGILKGVKFSRAYPGQKQKDGRRFPVKIEGSSFVVECTGCVICAGKMPDKRWESVAVKNESFFHQAGDNMFVAGDLVGGTVVAEAVGGGKGAAEEIINLLESKK